MKFQAPGIDSVTFSPDGKTLAWGCYGQTLCFMDRATGKDLRPTAEPSRGHQISCLSSRRQTHRFGKRGRHHSHLGRRDGRIAQCFARPCWRSPWTGPLPERQAAGVLRPGWHLPSLGHRTAARALAVLNDEGNSVVAAAFSADGKRLASGGNRGVIFLRDPATGKILEEIETDSIASLAFSPDGKTLAVVSDHDEKLLLQDLVTKKVKEIPVEGGGTSVAYSPDGKMLAVGCNETLLLLDTATNRVLKVCRGTVIAAAASSSRRTADTLPAFPMAGAELPTAAFASLKSPAARRSTPSRRSCPSSPPHFRPMVPSWPSAAPMRRRVILDLNNLTGKKRREQLTENELSAHWESLAAADAGKAYEARADLLHAPKSAVPFLAKRLQPAPAIDAKRVESLIKKLDSDVFRERDQASKELEELGELVREPLRKALAADPPPEARQRLQALLGKLDQFTPSQLRTLRAIEILESIGTPEALRIIDRSDEGK